MVPAGVGAGADPAAGPATALSWSGMPFGGVLAAWLLAATGLTGTLYLVGAGYLAAVRAGAGEIIDPRAVAVGRLAETYRKYATTGPVLPAMGYGEEERSDLSRTIAASGAEVVVVATPIDLARVIEIPVPAVRVRYDLQEIGRPTLEDVVGEFLTEREGNRR